MNSLWRSLKAKPETGQPLPVVFPRLHEKGIEFRRGDVHVIAAAPGVGKSVLAMALAIYARTPAAYFSLDTNRATMFARGVAMSTGHRVNDIMAIVESGNAEGHGVAFDRQNEHLHWVFGDEVNDSGDIRAELNAFALKYGEYPHLIVFDNLKDIGPMFSDGNEWQANEYAIDACLALAGEMNAAVVILHHVAGEYEDGYSRVPLSGLRGKVGKTPALVITMHRLSGGASWAIDVVKHRNGVSGYEAGSTVRHDLSAMRLEPINARNPIWTGQYIAPNPHVVDWRPTEPPEAERG